MFAPLLMLLLQPQELPECDEEAAEMGVQQEMNLCAHRRFLIADRELNEQWRLTRAHMQERDANWDEFHADSYDTRPGYFDSLLEAQRAWLTYRDAHCRTQAYEARGGSLEPLLYASCRTALTQARTEELRQLAQTY